MKCCFFLILLFSLNLNAALITDKNFRDISIEGHKKISADVSTFITNNKTETIMKAGRCLKYLSDPQIINEVHLEITTPSLIYLGYNKGRKVLFLQDFKERNVHYWNIWSDTKAFYYKLIHNEKSFHVIFNGFRLYVLDDTELKKFQGVADYLNTNIHKSQSKFKKLKRLNEDFISSLFHWIKIKTSGANEEIELYKKLTGSKTLATNLSYKKKFLLCREVMGSKTKLGKFFSHAIQQVNF
ncbi:MAG: hypothetical protein KC493_11910 [Bacteriovoracaceae bacterium]|nr:hypothetical protein [Bacteriovoracaceae bacterium]